MLFRPLSQVIDRCLSDYNVNSVTESYGEIFIGQLPPFVYNASSIHTQKLTFSLKS